MQISNENVISADFPVRFFPNKHNRYALEWMLRNMPGGVGEAMNFANRVTDTIENFSSANVALVTSFFTESEETMSLEEAGRILVAGDHIRVLLHFPWGLAFYHHGVYVGNDMVIEYTGRVSEQKVIRECSLESFARGKRIELDNREDAVYSPIEIVTRAKSRIGETAYCLAYNNCESFATWCRCGGPLFS